jgi:hypothetical protein
MTSGGIFFKSFFDEAIQARGFNLDGSMANYTKMGINIKASLNPANTLNLAFGFIIWP